MKVFDIFNTEFEKQLQAAKTYRDAFYATQERLGFDVYSSFESFKSTRTYHRRKTKRRD